MVQAEPSGPSNQRRLATIDFAKMTTLRERKTTDQVRYFMCSLTLGQSLSVRIASPAVRIASF